MKKFTLLFSFLLTITFHHLNAQPCTACTPVFSACPPTGGLCNRLDTAYANHLYEKMINFYMPETLTSPAILTQCGCNYVLLRQISVSGVSNLPGGITYNISNGGTFNVQNGDSIGCASFCGTPRVPGLYAVAVNLLANVTAVFNSPLPNVNQNNVPQQYFDTLLVLPDTSGGVSSFTFGNNGSSACDSIQLDLEAIISAPSPNLTRWFWDLGNGQTFEGKDPGFINYLQPDTYYVSLKTVIYDYVVKQINISNINGGWSGDCNEPTSTQDPEPYMKVTTIGYQTNDCSNVAPSTKTPSWLGLNATIPSGTTSLHLELWEDDACGSNSTACALCGGCTDDILDNYDLVPALGIHNLQGNTGNSNGTIRIDTVPGAVLTDTLVVIVHPFPSLPVIVAASDTFCSDDSVRISLSTVYNGYDFEWYQDTVFLTATDSFLYAKKAGNYRVRVTNQLTGCQSESDPKKITRVESPSSSVKILFNVRAFISPFPGSGYAVDWFYNGNFVTGQNGQFLPYLGDGLYEAQVYNINYPSCRAIATPKSVLVGVDEVTDNSIYDLSVFPNPSSGKFTLKFAASETRDIRIRIQNVLAQTVYERKWLHFTGEFNQEIELNEVGKGIYFVTLETEKGQENTKVVVR